MAKKEIVIVCCKLPHGIVLEHPMNPTQKFKILGKNRATILNADYARTEVPKDFWEQWVAVNRDFAPYQSGAIFVAKDHADADAISSEYENRLSGFEPMRTDGKDLRAAGVESVNPKE